MYSVQARPLKLFTAGFWSVKAIAFWKHHDTCPAAASLLLVSLFLFLPFTLPAEEEKLRAGVERLKLENRKLEERMDKLQQENNEFSKMVTILKRENSELKRWLRRERATKKYSDRAWQELQDTISRQQSAINELEEENADLRKQVERQNETLNKQNQRLEELRRFKEEKEEDEERKTVTLTSPPGSLSEEDREAVDKLRIELMEYQEFAKALQKRQKEDSKGAEANNNDGKSDD